MFLHGLLTPALCVSHVLHYHFCGKVFSNEHSIKNSFYERLNVRLLSGINCNYHWRAPGHFGRKLQSHFDVSTP